MPHRNASPLFVLVVASFSTYTQQQQQQQHSQQGQTSQPKLEKKYSFTNPFTQYTDGVIPGWTQGGQSTLSTDYIQLTKAEKNEVGYVWSKETIHMEAWEVLMEFHIGGGPTRGAGGGLAFWVVQDPYKAGSIYGYDEDYKGLGIFLDTYEGETAEETEAFVVAMMNDGKGLGGQENQDYYNNQIGVCFAGYRNLPHPVRMRVIFYQKQLQVLLDLDNTGNYQSCIATEGPDDRLVLPPNPYFGITASTGEHSDSHVVYNFMVANLDHYVASQAAQTHRAEIAEIGTTALEAQASAATQALDGHTGELLNNVAQQVLKISQHQLSSADKIIQTIGTVQSKVQESLQAVSTSTTNMDSKISQLTDGNRNQLATALSDLSSLKESVAQLSTKVDSVSQALAELKTSMNGGGGSLQADLKVAIDNMNSNCLQGKSRSEQVIANLKQNVAQLHTSHTEHLNTVKGALGEVKGEIQESGKNDSWVMWVLFACAQLAFVGFFAFYKRAKEYKEKKMF